MRGEGYRYSYRVWEDRPTTWHSIVGQCEDHVERHWAWEVRDCYAATFTIVASGTTTHRALAVEQAVSYVEALKRKGAATWSTVEADGRRED